jgi:hypothetical protein
VNWLWACTVFPRERCDVMGPVALVEEIEMGSARTIFLCVLLCWCAATVALAEDRKPALSEKQFRRASLALLEGPLGESAEDLARLIAIYVIQTPDAAVVLGQEEMKWAGKDKKRRWLLLAAYLAGNAQSQLNSGIKRNDRYSGLLSLFKVYRQVRAKEKKFRIDEVEQLLKMHKEDRLVGHLVELEKKKPTKLSAKDEEEIRKLLKGKK